MASVKNKKGNHNSTILRERDVNTTLWNPNDGQGLFDDDRAEDENDHVDNSSVSNASTNTASTKSGKLTKAEIRAAKREAKSAKSQRKSIKNQNKYVVAIKEADVENVAVTLHGEQNLEDSHPLASDKSIEDVMNRNRKYVKYIAEHKAMLLREVGNNRRTEMETRARKARKRKDRESISNAAGDPTNQHKPRPAIDEEEEALVNAVLAKFDIHVEPSFDGGMTPMTPVTPKRSSGYGKGSNQEKSLVLAQLRIAIAEDLQKHENEQRQTCIRAGGFWRYVGQPVFKRMMEITERIDWRTGAVKKHGSTSSSGTDQSATTVADEDHVEGAAVDDVQDWVEDVVSEAPV